MTGNLKDATANAVLDLLLGNQTLTPPDPWYLRLYTTAPGNGTAGTEVSTGTWTNYTAVSIDNDLVSFNAAASRSKDSAILIDFGTAAITGTPPVLKGAALCDAPTGGNQWIWFSFADRTINDGDPVTVPIGDLICTL